MPVIADPRRHPVLLLDQVVNDGLETRKGLVHLGERGFHALEAVLGIVGLRDGGGVHLHVPRIDVLQDIHAALIDDFLIETPDNCLVVLRHAATSLLR